MTRRVPLALLALSVIGVTLVVGSPRAGAATCATSSPGSGAFSATVCVGGVAPGEILTGDTTVLVTVTVSPARTVKTVRLFVGSQYIATDLASPWSVVIPTARWSDGARTIRAEASLKTGTTRWTTAKTSVATVFDNPAAGPTPPFAVYEPPGDPTGTFTVVAVGDGAAGLGASKTVVNRIAALNPELFLYLGDVYARGTFTEFRNWYGDGSTWYSRFRSITDPVPGNHEYIADASAGGYRDYWGDPPHAYSYDVGAWHLIALDSTEEFAQVKRGTAQYEWLVDDLHEAPACTLVYFHHPAYSAETAPASRLVPLWRLLADEGVDLVLSGHEHRYERWKPLDATGDVSSTGPVQYVVGTGGMSLYEMGSVPARVAAWNDTTFGALRLRLSPGTATSTFRTAGGTVLDTATRSCSPRVDHDPPSAPVLQASLVPPDAVDLAWTAATDDIGVTSYAVVRDGVEIATLGPAKRGFLDEGRAPDTTYAYVVEARDASGHVTSSNIASITTAPPSDTRRPGFP